MAARTIFSRRYFLAALGALGMTTNITAATAQTDNPGLQLAPGTGTLETLAFDGAAAAALDASLTLPEGWLLTPDDSADAAFAPAEIFAGMTRRFLCYATQLAYASVWPRLPRVPPQDAWPVARPRTKIT